MKVGSACFFARTNNFGNAARTSAFGSLISRYGENIRTEFSCPRPGRSNAERR
jgi:hypothetical protein